MSVTVRIELPELFLLQSVDPASLESYCQSLLALKLFEYGELSFKKNVNRAARTANLWLNTDESILRPPCR